jgi:Fe-S cluster assembly scaffold protein SufB
MSEARVVNEMLESIDAIPSHVLADDIARIQVHGNKVVGLHLVPGLQVEADELDNGLQAQINVEAGAVIKRPVHVCFGLLPEEGLQYINLTITAEQDSDASIQAHCTFPNAKDVEHKMDAAIVVEPGATYSYFERHVHGPYGGVLVVPKAEVIVHEGARFSTEFELLKGNAGKIEFEYDTVCHARSFLQMTARIKGCANDEIRIQEIGHLIGEEARAALTSHIALRDDAKADVYNKLTATADGARGHVDCKEIVLDRAVAKATPIVEVGHPGAHVTHEAAIGSVDSKQLQTLLTRGLTEDDATEMIINGLLSKR